MVCNLVKRRLSAIIILFFILSGFFAFSNTVFARSPAFTFINIDSGYGGSMFSDNIKPGEKVEGSFRLSLVEDVPVIFKIQFKDSGSYQLNKLKIEEKDTTYYSVTNWLTLPEGDLVYFESAGNKELPFIINVPEGALPGDYKGMFVASIQSYGDEAKEKSNELVASSKITGAKINIGIAIDFMLRVEGEINPSLDFKNLSYFIEKDSGRFNLVFNFFNNGNVGLIPKSHVKITDIFGKEVYTGDFNFSALGPYSEVSSSVKLNIKDFKLGYGIYTVEADLRYDVYARDLGSNLVYSSGKAVLKIYSFPWFLFLLIVGALLVIIFTVFYKNIRYYLLIKISKEYLVKTGDTLQTVSSKFRVAPNKIIVVNKLKFPFFLETGSKILIPFKNNKNEKK